MGVDHDAAVDFETRSLGEGHPRPHAEAGDDEIGLDLPPPESLTLLPSIALAVFFKWKTTPCSSWSVWTNSPISRPRMRSIGRSSGATTWTSIPRARSDAATSSPMKLAPRTRARFAALARLMMARLSLSERKRRGPASFAPGIDGRTGSAPVASRRRSKGSFFPSESATSHPPASIRATIVLRRSSMAFSE
jgi:hypothetical protein